jgi:hypothetical protein
MAGMGISLANAAERTTEALLTCADETDDARRLHCFDAVVAGMRSAPASPAAKASPPPVTATPAGVAPTAPPPVAAPAASPEDRFGARGDLKPEKHTEVDEITGTVTELGTRPHGELLVTLDNGHVWAEIGTSSKIKLKVGDTVKIERGSLGSFLLVAPNGRSSRVTRVR